MIKTECPECSFGMTQYLDVEYGFSIQTTCDLCGGSGEIGLFAWLKYKIDQFFSRRMPL